MHNVQNHANNVQKRNNPANNYSNTTMTDSKFKTNKIDPKTNQKQ